MGNSFEVAVRTGKEVTKQVEAYLQMFEKENGKENVPYLSSKKKMKDGSTIFTWFMKWNPYRYSFDNGFMDVLRKNDDKEDEDYAYMLVAVCAEGCSEVYCNDPGIECFADLCPGVIYPEEWYEDKSNKKFDIVLLEKSVHEAGGLSKKEAMKLYDLLKSETGFPLELENLGSESTAIGFITQEAGDKLNWCYDSLSKFIGNILADMELEKDDHIYRHKGLKIWLNR